jgi:hypothetical protein
MRPGMQPVDQKCEEMDDGKKSGVVSGVSMGAGTSPSDVNQVDEAVDGLESF